MVTGFYGLADIERLRFIARGRDLGFSLEEVRSLLQLAGDEGLSCVDVDRLARSHLSDIRARMADLQRMANELERVIASCHGGQRAECTILSTLRQPTPRTPTQGIEQERYLGTRGPKPMTSAVRPVDGVVACSLAARTWTPGAYEVLLLMRLGSHPA